MNHCALKRSERSFVDGTVKVMPSGPETAVAIARPAGLYFG